MLRLSQNLILLSKIINCTKFPVKNELCQSANLHTTPHWFSKTGKPNSKNINALRLKYKTG